MEMRELVKLITSEVLKQLNCPAQQEVLVLLTGGRAIWPRVKFKLEEMKNRGIVLRPVLSEAASRIFDPQELSRIFGVTENLEKNELLAAVKKSSLVMLPTLTVNTAAKLAGGIQDTEVTCLAGWALMMGKPVIAVTNSADPDSPELQRLGLAGGKPEHKARLRENLQSLARFGVKLVEADYLLPGVMQALGCDPINNSRRFRVEGVLTSAKVQAAAAENYKIIVAKNTVVTPLAKETAAEAGIEICYE